MKTLSFTEFRKNASGILDLVEKGDSVRVLRHGNPIAKIVPAGLRKANPAWQCAGVRLVAPRASLSRAVIAGSRPTSSFK
jgi:prevent-host-death family protein